GRTGNLVTNPHGLPGCWDEGVPAASRMALDIRSGGFVRGAGARDLDFRNQSDLRLVFKPQITVAAPTGAGSRFWPLFTLRHGEAATMRWRCWSKALFGVCILLLSRNDAVLAADPTMFGADRAQSAFTAIQGRLGHKFAVLSLTITA